MRRISTWVAALCTASICVIALMLAFVPISPLRQGGTAPFAGVVDPVENAVEAEAEGELAKAKPVSAAEDEGSQEAADDDSANYEKGAVLIALEDGVTLDQARDLIVRETDLQDVAIESLTDSYAKVTFNEQAGVKDAAKAIATSGAARIAQPNYEYTLEKSDETAVETSAQAGALAALSGSQLTTQANSVNDPKATMWALKNVQAFEAWNLLDKDKTTTNVTVAVIDNGFRLPHEEFTGNFVRDAKTGKYNKPLVVAPYNAYKNKTGAENVSQADGSHGTHVMGIIAAHVNNGKGTAGITNNRVQIMPIKVFDDKGEDTNDAALVKAIDYVTKNAKKYNVRVMNMSVGGGVQSSNWDDDDVLIMDSIAKAHDQGVVAVASAGNETKRYKAPFYHTPSDFEQCVAVINLENTNPDKPTVVRRNDTSNYNVSGQMAKDISAPGSDITSTAVGGDSKYVTFSGTSMAAPMVAGIMALMFTADNNLTVNQAVSKLYTGAASLYSKELNLGDPVWSREFGYGNVNAKTAVSNISYMSGATSLYVNEKQTYKLNLPKGAGGAKDVKWRIYDSTNGKLLSIESKGTKASVTGIRGGECVLVASTKIGSKSYEAFQTITVHDNVMNGYKRLGVGNKVRFYPASMPTSDKRVWKWKSSNPKVATVSSNGTVIARKKGHTVITATLSTNGKVVSTQKLAVVPSDLAGKESNLVASYNNPTYDGTRKTLDVDLAFNAGKNNEVKLVKGKDYKLSYFNNVQAGEHTATMTVTALPDSQLCSGTADFEFTIKPAPIKKATISSVADMKYTGKAQAPTPVVKLGKKTLQRRDDYTVAYLNKDKKEITIVDVKEKGTYYVRIKGRGNYTGTITKQFKIS